MPWIWTDDLATWLAPSTIVPTGLLDQWRAQPTAVFLPALEPDDEADEPPLLAA